MLMPLRIIYLGLFFAFEVQICRVGLTEGVVLVEIEDFKNL